MAMEELKLFSFRHSYAVSAKNSMSFALFRFLSACKPFNNSNYCAGQGIFVPTYHTYLRGNEIAESVEPLHIGLNVARLLHVPVQWLHVPGIPGNGEKERESKVNSLTGDNIILANLCLTRILHKGLNKLLGTNVIQTLLN